MFLPNSELTGLLQSRLTVGFLTVLPRRNRRERQVSHPLKEGQAEFSCYSASGHERLARQHHDRAKMMLSCQRGGGSWGHCSGEKFGGKRAHTHCN